ncbi:MAG: ArnT family glycosyltransferase [Planctomycetota bacterium]
MVRALERDLGGQENSMEAMFGWKRAIIILVVLQVALSLAYLNSVPRVNVDEVWDSSLGWTLAAEGTLKHPFVEGLGGMDIHFVQNRVVLALVCAAVFTVTDYSMLASRIGSLLFGVFAVISLFAVMRRWFGAKQAFWIGLATIVHPWFFDISRRIRPEIYYTALALAFLWLMVLYFDSGSRRTAFFAGVVAGLAGLTHANGLTLVFSIGCSTIVWLRAKSISRLILWGAVGFVLTILPWLMYVFWAVQDPRVSFAEQMLLGTLHTSLLRGEIHRWKHFLQWPTGAALAVVMLVSWVAAWRRSSTADRTVATIIGLFVLILPFASINPTGQYLAAITGLFSALLVRLIWWIRAGEIGIWPNRYKLRSVIAIGTMVIYLSTAIAAIGMVFYRLRGADFDRVIDRVAKVVGPQGHVVGDPIFWIGHDRYRYGPYLVVPQGIRLTKAIEMVREHDFDYAVRTFWLHVAPGGIARPPRSMPKFREECLLDQVCRIFGTKVDEFYDPYYGPIEIYKLNWDRPLRILKGDSRPGSIAEQQPGATAWSQLQSWSDKRQRRSNRPIKARLWRLASSCKS